jgi:4-hydroxybenzoate polyprenyltransferase
MLSTLFSFSALLRLTRFGNLMIIGLAQYFSACFLLKKEYLFDWHLFVLSSATILVAAAGYIINDYYDIKIDLINKPDRVVIGKKIPRRIALFLHSFFSSIGVGLGFLLNVKIGFVVFFSSFLLWLYSNNFKRLPFIGNVTVALLIGLAIELVNLLYRTDSYLVIAYAAFSFFMTLVREIVKDMEDLKGDSTYGCKTLPIIWGLRKTKTFIYLLTIAFAALVFLLNDFYIKLPVSYFGAFLFLPLVLLTVLLVKADTIKDFRRISQLCKVILLLGIISMIFVNR